MIQKRKQTSTIQLNKKNYCFGILLLFLFSCSLPPKPFMPDPKANDNYREAIRYSRKYLEQFMKKTGTVGMAVAVIDSDKVVYSEGFGYADKKTKKKVTDSTTFMIGSITKLFTGTAIMQLVEQGAIVLDSPITTYLPEFTVKSRFNARPITVRDLLTHESGLSTDINNGFFIGQRSYAGTDTLYRTVPALFSSEYVSNPPKTGQSYSNIGFSLLGNIIDRVSKRTYSEYIQDSIFAKLGMNHSAIGFDNDRVSSLFAKTYTKNNEVDPLYIRDISAGAIVTNVLDFSLFVKMLFLHGSLGNSCILNESTLNQMWTPQNSDVLLDFGMPMGLAYGLTNGTRVPSKVIGHNGGIPSFYSSFVAFPDLKLGFVVFINSSQGDPTEPIGKLLETFYEAKTGNKLPEQLSPKPQPVVKLSATRLNEIAGFYETMGSITKAQIKGNNLVFSFYGTPVTLIPHSDSTFTAQYKLFGLIPLPNRMLRNMTVEMHTVANRKIALVRFQGNIAFVAEKVTLETPPKEWLVRIGSYEVVNERKAVYANKEEEENKYKMQNVVLSYDSTNKDLSFNNTSIKVISSSEAVIRGLGRNAGEMILTFLEDGKEYLWAWGYAFRKIPVPVK